MGVLYARVDGAWVPVIAPAPAPVDEVWVGPSAPAASETELWVDSDLTPAPMLFAKIGGTWTSVSSPPTNEVAVQPDAPTGNEELWYDSDAPGYTPDDLRWQSAWGVIGRATVTANQTGFTSTTAPGQEISGLGTSVNSVKGRRYRISCDVAAYAAQHNVQVNFVLRLNRTYTMQQCNFPLPTANYGNRNYLELIYEPATSGVETWTMNVHMTLGAGTFNVNASTDQPLQLVIEDIGPVLGSATQPPPVGGLPAGMKVYGPFESGLSAPIAPQQEGTVSHTHNLALPDPSKCVVAAQAMDGSWAAAAAWRTTISANSVMWNVVNVFQGNYSVQVKFRYMLFQGA